MLNLFCAKIELVEQIKINDLSIKKQNELIDSFKIEINELNAKKNDCNRALMEMSEQIEVFKREQKTQKEVYVLKL
jgi:hypothetical protein